MASTCAVFVGDYTSVALAAEAFELLGRAESFNATAPAWGG